jgi:membrane protease YdiL (CAAX protease family)
LALGLALFVGAQKLGQLGGALAENVAPVLAVCAWIVPAYVLCLKRGHDPFADHGLLSRPTKLLGATAISLGLLVVFVGAFAAFAASQGVEPKVAAFDPGALLLYGASTVVLAALPEEYFFRGVLQPALDAEEPARRFLGAPVGRGLLVTAVLFALCHVALEPSLHSALVFFPGLWFGWLRARTGSIVPGVLFHALANVVESGLLAVWPLS